MDVVMYTDGGARPNPGYGGWAVILRYGEHERVLSGGERETTSNRMEIRAAIEGLRALKRPCTVDLYTDSAYLLKGGTKWLAGWQASRWEMLRADGRVERIKNADLWQPLASLLAKHEVRWHKVKAHTGDPINERVDLLARQAREAVTPVAVLPADVPHLYIRISCRGNPGPGGWGVVVVRGDEVVERGSGGSPATTNNRLELTAVIAGLRLIPQQLAVICTTSDYLYQGATKWIRGWRKRNWRKKSGEEIANGDLWTKIDMLNGRYPLRWSNVKGEELAWLEEANQLANQEAEEMLGRAT